MLPLISVENAENMVEEILANPHDWRKDMIHYIKEENPELNFAIIEIAQKGGLEAKALATGAYMAYKLLEKEASNEQLFDLDDEE